MSDNSDNTRLHALIIGIDGYTKGVPKLQGAVADATKIRDWVVDTLRVPTRRVQVLYDAEATRKAIIQALKTLATKEEIEPGDPILIYYAGHGSEGPRPEKWHWDSPTIQMILPYDYKHTVDQKTVEGIPDRTLGLLISEIATKKGDNITVIFDCCNSGSGTRSGRSTSQDVRIRGVKHQGQISEELDDDLLPRSRGAQEILLPQFRYYGLKSHVLLAACASHEYAHEKDNSGRFTAALLKTLSTADLSELTYEGLINSLGMLDSQTPQCEGVNQGRVVFNKKIPNTNAILEAKLKGRVLEIRGAGSIHGIEAGRTFSVWSSRADIKAPPLGIVTVEEISANSSTATWKPGKPRSDFVVQLTGNPNFKLPIHVPEVIKGQPFYKELFVDTQSKIQSVELTSKDKATIGLIYTEGGRIGFEMLNAEEKKQVITQTALPDVDELLRALQHISNYYYHRDRANPRPPMVGKGGSQAPFSSQFSLEVYKVIQGQNYDDDVSSALTYERTGLNLNGEGGVVITIEPGKKKADEDDMYGFEIHSQWNIKVYPYLFYFDSSTFSIACIYSPAIPAQSQAPGPLGQGNSVAIGYGSAGLSPRYLFFSNKNLDYERGYLRLYISTKYVNLSSIAQGDLFSGSTRGLQPVPTTRTVPPFWDSITIPVTIQRVNPTPRHMIGVIGSRGSGKDKFLEELFKSLHGHYVYKAKYSLVEEYRLNLTESKQSITIVDLPGLQNENLDQQLEALKAIAAYTTKQCEQGAGFTSLIWCYNISSGSPLTAEAVLNWKFVEDIAGREMFKNITILTTGWNTTTRPGSFASGVPKLRPYTSLEKELENCCAELVVGGAQFKRLALDAENDASGDRDRFIAPLALISSLLGREPQELQVQREVRGEGGLSAATAWQPLLSQINEVVQGLEMELKEQEDELGDDVETIRMEIEEWKKTLREIDRPIPCSDS